MLEVIKRFALFALSSLIGVTAASTPIEIKLQNPSFE